MLDRFAAPLIAALILGLFAPAHSDAEEKAGQRWAVLIGVNDYIQAKDLEYCVADQQALRDTLLKSGFPADQVFLLADGAKDNKYLPFKANLEKQLELVLSLVEKDDVLVVAFSGHGVHLQGKSYLCPTDAKLDDPTSLLSLDTVYNRLQQCPAAFKLLVVDACRNDPQLAGQRSLVQVKEGSRQFAAPLDKPPQGVVLLNSCTAGEISWEEKDFGHGVFMHYLLDGLKGQADEDKNGRISLSELARYAGTKTKVYVARKFNDSQRPFLKGDVTLEALDFELAKREVVSVVPNVPLPIPMLPAPARPEPPVPIGDLTLDEKAAKELQAAAARALGREIIETNTLGMKFAIIPPGEFLMGSPESEAGRSIDETPHRVRITKAFYMGTHEVTFAQFLKFYHDAKYKTDAERDGFGGFDADGLTQEPRYTFWNMGRKQAENEPVVNVTWNDATAFCQWLSKKEGEKYRLPTEAEWEYTCRAGTSTRFHVGKECDNRRSNCDYQLKTTSAVGRYAPNAWGFYDMHGNVWEWCSDWYGDRYYENSPIDDPQGLTAGSSRVARGGGFVNSPVYLRSANRDDRDPLFRARNYGFRVVLAPYHMSL